MSAENTSNQQELSKTRNLKYPSKSRKCIICAAKPNDFPNRRFHGFPKDPELSEEWANIVAKKWVLNAAPADRINRFIVCSSHFEVTDYLTASRSKLKPNAVPKLDTPTINLGSLKNKLDDIMKCAPATIMDAECSSSMIEPEAESSNNMECIADCSSRTVHFQDDLSSSKECVTDASMSITRNTSLCQSPDLNDIGMPIQNSTPCQSPKKLFTTGQDENPNKRRRILTPKTSKIKSLSTKVYYLRRKFSRVGGSLTQSHILKAVKCMVSPVIYQFIAAQLKFSRVSKFERRWSIRDKNLALQLYLASPKAYNSLCRWFYLPSVSTLRKSVSGIDAKPGFNRGILSSIKLLASRLKPNDRKCIISFDEMKLQQGLSYDRKYDTVIGYEDYGSFEVSNPRKATHALVFMVRGLCQKWKQVFGYFFSCQSASSVVLRHLLHEGVRELVACGLDPIAVVCDQGPSNQRLYVKELCISPEKPHFNVEIDEGKMHKLYALFDAPHLLKCVRNNFARYAVKFLHNGQQKIADWAHIRAAWEFDKDMTYRFAPKLTKKHEEVDGLSAMNVRLAAQVLSQSVASILCYMTAVGKVPGSNTADFCAIMNDLFDSVNGRMMKHPMPLLSAVTKTSPHLDAWKTFSDFLRSVEFQTPGKKKITFPCLQGWLITLSAFRQLIPELLVDIPYIMMSRFTQDALEIFFL